MRYGTTTRYYDARRARYFTFKSKHEYMWATWFDRYELDWEYEPVTFLHPDKNTKDTRLTYTPDFGLELNSILIEVKTYGKQHVKNLVELCNRPLLLIFGHPLKCDIHVQFPENIFKTYYFSEWEPAYNFARHGLPSWIATLPKART